MKKIMQFKPLLLILLLVLLLIISLSNIFLNKPQTTTTRADSSSDTIKLALTVDTPSARPRQPIKVDIRTSVDNSTYTMPILAYAVGIQIPKPFIVDGNPIFHVPLAFNKSYIVDKGNYYEIQLIAANKEGDPYILQNNTSLVTFSIMSPDEISNNISFTKEVSYPSIIDASGKEVLDKTTLADLSIAVFANTPIPTATSTPVPTRTPTPTLTNTPIPTATNTPTITPTNTSTPTPTATSTPIPTATPTIKPSATNTPIPPTNTPTLTYTPSPTVNSCPNFTSGNADCSTDGVIGLMDFVCWKLAYDNNGHPATNCGPSADFDNSGTVDLFDFVIWLKNYKK